MPYRLCLLLLVLFAAAVTRGDVPAAGGFAYPPGNQSHAWAALELPSPVLLYLPARGGAGSGPVKPSEAGATRMVLPLTQAPLALAAWENRAFLLFDPPPGVVGDGDRPVLSVRAVPGPMGSVWAFDNLGGRLESLPSLAGGGKVRSFAGSERGPAALVVRDGLVEARILELHGGGGGEWREIGLPDGAPSATVQLLAVPRGIALVDLAREEPGVWMGRFLEQGFPEGEEAAGGNARRGPVEVAWTFQPLSLATARAGGERTRAPLPEGPVVRIGGVLVYTARDGDSGALQVWSPSASGSYLLATLAEVGESYGLAALDDVGRLALIWAQSPAPLPGAKPGTKTTPEVRIAEVSITDGQVFYHGLAQAKGPVSPDELKLLTVALVGVMALILLFVLKPEESRSPVHLPKGVALAEPGRRTLAAAIDLLVAAIITGAITGRSLVDLLLLTGVFTDPQGMLGLLVLAASGFAVGTIGEALFARSPGKALAGCAVAVPRMVQVKSAEAEGTEDSAGAVSVERTPTLGRPSLWRAAVRNLIKWFAPPIAMMGLSAPDHRHRGDIAAGTVVVVAVEEP